MVRRWYLSFLWVVAKARQDVCSYVLLKSCFREQTLPLPARVISVCVCVSDIVADWLANVTFADSIRVVAAFQWVDCVERSVKGAQAQVPLD